MRRYIDADLLKQTVQDNITRYFTCGTGGYCLAEDVVEDIDTFPTADVVEVRHGEWVSYLSPISINRDLYYKCSICGVSDPWQYTGQGHPNYCPNCGAYMRGTNDGEE